MTFSVKFGGEAMAAHPPQGSRESCQYFRDDGKLCGHDEAWHYIAMAKAPDEWPAWPRLPLKRSPKTSEGTYSLSDLETGFLIEDMSVEEAAPVIYIGTIFDAVPTAGLPTKAYESLEALFADRWVVD